MRAKTRIIIALILFSLLIMVGTSCAPRKVIPDRVQPRKNYLSADPQVLLNNLIARNAKIKTLRSSEAELEYRFTYSTRTYQGTGLRFAVKNPGMVYARASATGVGDIFILVSNGEKYWVEAPRDKEVFTGSVSNLVHKLADEDTELWERFTPSILFEGLLIDDLSEYNRSTVVTHPDFYIIDLLDERENGELVVRRRIWIEREGLTVRRHRVYNDNGELMTEANLFRYITIDGISIPQQYRIERYWDELSLKLTLNNIKLNSELSDSLFEYDEVPADFRLIKLDERENKNAESGKSKPAVKENP